MILLCLQLPSIFQVLQGDSVVRCKLLLNHIEILKENDQ